ncbi:hypothetical protein GCM10011610_35970 [Nocardia rhizosphaerihabitans]|uniref:Uncharacterized protein n=1 Tax=Nocardia rhizosphaerihabitans TaxID=1691570 RepID=A0ABQ2KHI0_9NOCA|nr:hypothetical protein GCM10011610_35970 [Nocardia rhizosphaerihabitans]
MTKFTASQAIRHEQRSAVCFIARPRRQGARHIAPNRVKPDAFPLVNRPAAACPPLGVRRPHTNDASMMQRTMSGNMLCVTNLVTVLIHLRELPCPFWLDFPDRL